MMKTSKRLSKLTAVLFMFGAFLFTVNSYAQQEIEMTGTDKMKFDVTEITAKPGEEITVKLYIDSKLSANAMSHNFVLLKQGVDGRAFSMSSAQHKDNEYIDPSKEDDVIAYTDMGAGDETVEVTFNAPDKAGEYEYVCTFPGHYISGMKGVLKVQ